MRGGDHDWSLNALEAPPGVAFFDFATGLLPSSGRGPLPEGAHPLPDEPEPQPNQIRFSAGAVDAVIAGESEGQGPLAAAAAVLELLRSKPSQRGLSAVVDRLAEAGDPANVDRLIEAVANGRPPRDRLAALARWLCRHGTRREVVKAGIALLGVSGTETDVALITRLGLLEELTLYALVAFQNLLPNSERAVFNLAQQVRGWGRVQAVRRLRDTSDEEIRRWLLYGGYENDVMIEETAFVAATVGELRRRLDEAADDSELVDHAGELLSALAMGGPAEDLSDYADTGPALSAYLRLMEQATPSLRRLHHLVGIAAYLSEDLDDNPHLDATSRGQLHTKVEAILARPEWVPMVREVLESDDAREVAGVVGVAEWLGVETRPVLWNWLAREPLDGFFWYRLIVGASREEMRRLVDAAAALLPLDQLATGPGDELGLGREYEADNCLGYVLQGVREFPGEGWGAISVGLRNRVVRNRNQALRAFSGWPRNQWPEDAEDVLQKAFWNEPRDDVRARIRALIDGVPLPE